jgi:hypothetical protein
MRTALRLRPAVRNSAARNVEQAALRPGANRGRRDPNSNRVGCSSATPACHPVTVAGGMALVIFQLRTATDDPWFADETMARLGLVVELV